MAPAENPSRERILERIRTALRSAAPRREPAGPPGARQIFPPVGDLLERFQAECKANLTEVIVTECGAASAAAIQGVLASLPEGEIYVQDAPEFRSMAEAWSGRESRWSSEGGPREACQATLTLAEGLAAATGSILVSSSTGGRGASVVAPCHIVLARVEQLMPDLEAVLSYAYEKGIAARNSFVGLITGTSRTADIQRVLVIGAHGARRVVVVLQIEADR